MLGFIRQLFCKHKHVIHAYTLYGKGLDGHYRGTHYWKCKRCGKIIKGD